MRRAAVGTQCPRCGVVMGRGIRNPSAATVDHIVPLRLGGTNDRGNFRVLCLRCNCRAGQRLGDAIKKSRTQARPGRRRAVVGFRGPLSQ
jgi:5-methylcytosine-specific restriction endonuclease McrA